MDTHEREELPADLIPTNEAVRLLPGARPGKSVHLATVYRFVQEGRLRAWKVGRRLLVSRAEVLALIQAVKPKQPRPDRQPEATRAQADRQTSEILRKFGLA